MNNYPTPLDYTGFGPSQTGFFPTASQIREAEMRRFYSSRAAQAMQYSDPWITQFAAGAARMAGATGSAGVRDFIFNTAPGQGAIDIATMLRSNGMLGQGNPMAYSYHINRGITSGGFGVNALNPQGMAMGPMQTVYGSGPLSDRLTIAAQDSLLKNLYGSGTADPSKLNGMNMESAGFIFAEMARGGPLRNAVTLKRIDPNSKDAIGTKLRVAMDGAHDPTIRAGLAGLTVDQRERMQALSVNGSSAEIDQFTSEFSNPKLQQELKAVIKASEVTAVNHDLFKKSAASIRELSKGIASLRDVYEGMSDPQVLMQMQALTGLTSAGMQSPEAARKAAMTVANLRGAAEAAGYDANRYFEWHMAATSGMDRGFSEMVGMRAGYGGALSKQAFSALGVTPMGMETIMADAKSQYQRGSEMYQGVKALYSGISRIIDPQKRARAQALLKEFEGTTDPKIRRRLELEARSLLGGEYGSYAQYMTSSAATYDAQRMNENADGIGTRFAEAIASESSVRAPGELKSLLGDDAAGFLGSMGIGGLVELEDISRNKNVPAGDKVSQMLTVMTNKGGLSRADATRMLRQLYDSNGAFKGGDDMRKALHHAVAAAADPSANYYGRNATAASALLKMDQNANTARSGLDGDLSLKGILNAFLSGKTGVLDSDEGKLALLQAMKADGMNVIGKSGKNLTERILTGMNLKDGLTDDMVKQIDAAVGGGFSLAGAAGYKGTADLLQASKSDIGMKSIIDALQGNSRVSVFGGRNGFNIVARDALDDIDPDAQTARFKEYALTAKYLYPNASARDVNAALEGFRSGGAADIGLAADTGTARGGYFGASWRDMANYGRLTDVASRINQAGDAEIEDFMRTSSGQQLLQQLKGERDMAAKFLGKGGGFAMRTINPTTNEVEDGRVSRADISWLSGVVSKLEAAADASRNIENVTITNAQIINYKDTK